MGDQLTKENNIAEFSAAYFVFVFGDQLTKEKDITKFPARSHDHGRLAVKHKDRKHLWQDMIIIMLYKNYDDNFYDDNDYEHSKKGTEHVLKCSYSILR